METDIGEVSCGLAVIKRLRFVWQHTINKRNQRCTRCMSLQDLTSKPLGEGGEMEDEGEQIIYWLGC